MSKTILAKVDGFTPLPDLIVARYGRETASVWGSAWRYCQMSDGVCRASMEKIGKRIGLSRQSTQKHMNILVQDGFFEDITPDLKNKPHTYRDTGKVGMYNRFGIGVNLLDSSGKEVDSDCQEGLHEDSIKETPKDTFAQAKKNSPKGIEWKILNDEPITEDDLMDEDDLFRKEAEEFAWTISQNNADLQSLALTFMLTARTLPDLDRISFWRKTLRKMKNHKPFPVAPRHVQEATRRALRDKLTLDSPESVYKVAGRLSDEKWCPEADPEGAGNWAGRDEKWRQLV